MGKTKRVYISGKVTGTSDYVEKFAFYEKKLRDLGYEVINPVAFNALLPQDLDYDDFMTVCYTLLSLCDYIFLIDDWVDSNGAKLELKYAIEHNIKILEEKVER